MARLSDKVVSSWFLGLSDTLKSGFSPADAIGIAGAIPNRIRSRLVQRIEAGCSWREAVENEGAFLEPAERFMISAAEQSGNLPQTLKELGEIRKEAATFRSRIIFAGALSSGNSAPGNAVVSGRLLGRWRAPSLRHWCWNRGCSSVDCVYRHQYGVSRIAAI